MNKVFLALFALTLIAVPARTQEMGKPTTQSGCALTAATSPGVRGLRLGMSTDQVLALFPGSAKREDTRDALESIKTAHGGETVYLTFDGADARGDSFAGVDSVSAGVSKGRVVDFSVIYVGQTWRSIDEWVAKLASALKLPTGRAWLAGPSENPNKVLKCKGVEIEAAIQGGGASVRIRNNEYLHGMDHGPTAGDEKKRRDFKP